MGSKVKISVVIPTYNREKTIERAIESVILQTVPPNEIIITDDGSEDNTKKIVYKFIRKVKYLYQNNSGVSAARNRGIIEAKSDWIAFLDSDDYWDKFYIEKMDEAINFTKEKASIYFANVRVKNEKKKIIESWEECKFKIYEPYKFYYNAANIVLMPKHPMWIQASIICKKVLIHIGGFNNNIKTREDTDLFLRLCLRYPACAVNFLGATITSDSQKDNRLTNLYGPNSLKYMDATITIYNNILKLKKKYNKNIIFELQYRLCQGYFSFLKMHIVKHDLKNSLKYLWKLISNNPYVVCKLFYQKITKKTDFRNKI